MSRGIHIGANIAQDAPPSPVRSPIAVRGCLDPLWDFLGTVLSKTQAAAQAGILGGKALDDEYSSMFWSTLNAGVQREPSNYNQNSNAADLRSVDQNTLNEETQLMIPVTALGAVPGFFPAELDCNGFALIPRLYDESTNTEIQSSDSARLYVRFNSVKNPWIPFSLSTQANPLASDYTGIARPIRRVWLRVTTVTHDSAFPFVIVAFLKNVSLAQGGGAPQIYSVPAGSPASAGAVRGVGTGGTTGVGGVGTGAGTGSGGAGPGGGGSGSGGGGGHALR